MLGVTRETLLEEEASMRGVLDFFSVASTIPLAALMPREVTPWFTAFRAYSGGGSVRGVLGWLAGGCGTYLYQLSAVFPLAFVSFVLFVHSWPYLGEKVVREKEYLSAMMGLWWRVRCLLCFGRDSPYQEEMSSPATGKAEGYEV